MPSKNTGADAARDVGSGVDKMSAGLAKAKAVGGTLLKTLNDLVGPLQLAAGAALTFVAKLTLGIGKSETLRRGLEKIARIQFYSPQFAKLLGGLDAAKKRIAEIEKFAHKGPFSFDDAAEGNKKLQILSRGLLAGKMGMTLVGDAAAVAGTSFNEMASIIGPLYDDLANDRPIEGAVQQLVSLGVISADAADKLLLMKSNGVQSASMWSALEAEIGKAKGGMDAAKQTITGLEKSLEDARTANDKAFAEPFDEGKRRGLEAAIKLTEALRPAFETAGKVLSVFYNAVSTVANGFADLMNAIPGLKNVLAGLVTGFLALIGLLTVFSVVTTAEMILSLGRMVIGLMATATATTFLGRAMVGLRAAISFALGPVGILILLASSLAGLFASMSDNAGTFGETQQKLKSKIDETTSALKKQIGAIQTQAEKATAMATANQNVLDAEKNLEEAKEKRDKAWFKQGPNKEVTEARKALNQARDTARKIKETPTDASVESLMGDDYKALKEESEKRLAAYQEEFDALQREKRENGGLSPEKQDRQEEIIRKMQAESFSVTKEAADRRFQQRQVAGESQIAAMREVAGSSGNAGLRDAADKKEDELFREKRRKELQEKGFQGDALSHVLEQETLLNQVDRERKRQGSVTQSSLAAIGGSGGFAGVVNDIPKQMLQRLQELVAEVREINGTTKKPDPDKAFEQ